MEHLSFTSTDEEKQEYQEELLLDFPEDERTAIFKVFVIYVTNFRLRFRIRYNHCSIILIARLFINMILY